MRKTIALVLVLCCMLTLVSCGNKEAAPDQVITIKPADDGKNADEEKEAVYWFEAEGVSVIPGSAFDASLLPEAESVYQVPSCAIQGTDNVYNYGEYEITAFDDGTGETVYSIYFLSPNVKTREGVAIGDPVEALTAAYGEDAAEDGAALIYTDGNANLTFIVEEGLISSIEYLYLV